MDPGRHAEQVAGGFDRWVIKVTHTHTHVTLVVVFVCDGSAVLVFSVFTLQHVSLCRPDGQTQRADTDRSSPAINHQLFILSEDGD